MARRTARIRNNTAQATRPKRGRAAWLILTGLVAGVAGGIFAGRMAVPAGNSEPDERPATEPADTSQPEELLPRTEPVEISTRMRPGEWTEESLQAHIEDYRQQIRNMGATDAEIVTNVERTEEGAARVVVSWNRTGL
ncbi:hypothetical protein [Paenarthrobacter ureafaciens]|uniref:hypothetical protein n=1 Tax=Paenarthrobacter ureafaciens TaxID=37931 RepID=UPI001FB3AE2D|nr:hypothetical protein [Paenarthrobacter ureafaciens]UOD80784.1 hypothetical protein MQZ73_16970 [Paenarthrobacter ureafaciens]WNZ03443.1 hypothetical protein PVT25_17640 [Paenarthrobacter ureafaciens]